MFRPVQNWKGEIGVGKLEAEHRRWRVQLKLLRGKLIYTSVTKIAGDQRGVQKLGEPQVLARRTSEELRELEKTLNLPGQAKRSW